MGQYLKVTAAAISMIAICASAFGQATITYIANEGVMLEGGVTKVLIDPFFKVGFGLYQVPQIGDMATFLKRHPALGNANAIFVSHRHADHIDPRLVASYLNANPHTRLVSSAQATDSVVNQFNIAKDRVVNLLPKMNEEILSKNVDGVEFKFAWMRHGNQRNFEVVNLCFVTTIGGRKVMHLGDAEINPSNFKHVDFSTEGIDVLLAPYWWLIEEYGGPAIIRDNIKPKKIIAFHVSNDIASVKTDILKTFPGAIFFDTAFFTIQVD